jgi:hypothetical protein
MMSMHLFSLLLSLAAGQEPAWQPELCGELDGGTGQRHFLFVTVADWNEPLLAYVGERERDAVVAALAEAGFIVTRDAEVLHEMADGGLKHGVFRRWKDGGRQDRIDLVLIAENPLSGVNEETMGRALDCGRAVETTELFLLGPTYSGSAWSVRAAIERSAGKDSHPVRVVSGSATGDELKTILERVAPDAGPSRITFERTVHSNAELVTAVEGYLGAEDAGQDLRIAILSEQSSVYGADMRNNLQANHSQVLELDGGISPAEVSASANSVPVLILPFPMHIAWRLGEAALLPVVGAVGASEVQLPTGVERSSAEAALAQLLATISIDEYRYVGIVATDVRDRLFLTRRIHTYSPDVRIILFESDVLYSLSSFAETRGALIVSTYPLLNENQLWASTGPASGIRQQFESDPAEGAYNAAVYLLQSMKIPGPIPSFLEYGPPFRSSLVEEKRKPWPPVWVSIQGRQAWPIQVVASDSAGDLAPAGVGRGPTASWTSDYPGVFHLFVILVALGVLGTALCFLSAPPSKTLLARASSWPAVTVPIKTRGQGQPSRLVSAVSVVVWLLWAWMLLKLVDIWFHPAATGKEDWRPVHVLVGFILASATLASLLCSAVAFLGGVVGEQFSRPTGYENTRDFIGKNKALCTVGVAVGFAFLALLEWSSGEELFQFELSRQRYVHLTSGVSPLPLVYFLLLFVGLGTFGISTYSASRRAYGRLQTVQWPWRLPEALLEAPSIDSNTSNLLVLSGVLAIGVVIAAAIWSRLNRPLEQPVLGYIIHFLVSTAPAAALVACALALIRWSTVRTCLRRVAFSRAFPKAGSAPETTVKDASIQQQSLLFSSQPPRAPIPSVISEDFPFAYLGLHESSPAPYWRERLAEALREEFVLVRRLFLLPLFGPPLVMVALASYPIEPNRLLLLLFSVLQALFVLLAFYVVMAVEREPLVADLENRNAGGFALSPSVLVKVAVLVIPLLFAVFGSRLPSLGTSALDAVQQVASLIK